MKVVSFTTGPTSTSAEIYLNVSMPGGAPPVYADDFGLQMNTEANSGQAYVPAAAPSSWINPLGGSWGTAANWSADAIPPGTGATADFSTLDITSDVIVSLNSARTIGNLVFSDANPGTAASWVLDKGANPANTLTLASGVTPAITVGDLGTGRSATISAIIAGTSGLNKVGNGTLVLTNANTYTGATMVGGGTLDIKAQAAASTYTIASGATLVFSSGSVVNGKTMTFNGTGTLKLANNVTFGGSGITDTVALGVGGLVWVTNNATVTGSSYNLGKWNSNLASLQVDSGSTINFVEAGANGSNVAQFDALNGGGTVTGGFSASPNNTVLKLGANNGSGSFSGVIANGNAFLTLTKVGTGTQTLSGASTFTGDLTVSGGTLDLTGRGAGLSLIHI